MSQLPDAASLYDAIMVLSAVPPHKLAEVFKDFETTPEFEAASEQSIDVVKAIEARGDGSVDMVSIRDVDPAIMIQIFDLLLKFITYKAKTCKHADPYRPIPLIGSAWMPGLITCLACAHRHGLSQDDPRNWSCDLCGTVVPRDRADTDLHVFKLPYGPLLYQWGTCTGCLPISTK